MSARKYVLPWLSRSLHRGFGTADFLGGLAGSAATVWAHFDPRWQWVVNLWWIPIVALAGGMLFRLIVTPFEMLAEAHRRADAAEQKLNEKMGWRRKLSEDERQAIITETKGFRPPKMFEVIHHGASEESARYAAQFAEALEAAGWEVHCGKMMQDRHRFRGLSVSHAQGTDSPDYLDALARGMGKAGLRFARTMDKGDYNRLYVDLQED